MASGAAMMLAPTPLDSPRTDRPGEAGVGKAEAGVGKAEAAEDACDGSSDAIRAQTWSPTGSVTGMTWPSSCSDCSHLTTCNASSGSRRRRRRMARASGRAASPRTYSPAICAFASVVYCMRVACPAESSGFAFRCLRAILAVGFTDAGFQ